jgi:uncharacterized damage-inducible protein DinB
MSIISALDTELDQEMITTRRLLARVPDGKGEWKPHPKSFPLGHLAQLVSWMPAWVGETVGKDKLDLAAAPKYTFEDTATLLRGFDANVASTKAALARASDAELDKPWSLVRGDQVLLQSTRGVMVRSHISHLSHHRGQLTVYLRMLDVPIPPIYGPTADER